MIIKWSLLSSIDYVKFNTIYLIMISLRPQGLQPFILLCLPFMNSFHSFFHVLIEFSAVIKVSRRANHSIPKLGLTLVLIFQYYVKIRKCKYLSYKWSINVLCRFLFKYFLNITFRMNNTTVSKETVFVISKVFFHRFLCLQYSFHYQYLIQTQVYLFFISKNEAFTLFILLVDV